MKTQEKRENGTLGGKIRTLREMRGWSQEEFAEKLYLKKAVISQYENNQIDMKVSRLIECANILGVDAAILISDADEDAVILNMLFRMLSNKDTKKIAIEQLKVLAKYTS